MPRTNTAAKKSARARQRETGEPYMLSRRRSAQEPQDWTIGLERDSDDRLPYDFVADPQGHTYGLSDHGKIIGFTNEETSRRIDHYWDDVCVDPSAMVGKWMVTMDRFTNGWSTWRGAVRSIYPAIPRAERAQFMGGTSTPPTDYEAALMARRALRDRDPLFEENDERTLLLDLCADNATPYWVEVDGDWLVRAIDSAEVIGRLERVSDSEGETLTPQEFTQDPKRLLGCSLIVWSSDRRQVGLCPVIEVSLA